MRLTILKLLGFCSKRAKGELPISFETISYCSNYISETFHFLPRSSKLDLALKPAKNPTLICDMSPAGIKWPITLKVNEIGTWELL